VAGAPWTGALLSLQAILMPGMSGNNTKAFLVSQFSTQTFVVRQLHNSDVAGGGVRTALRSIRFITFRCVTLRAVAFHYVVLRTVRFHYVPSYDVTYHYVPLRCITYR
jgi:hypothetical protein